jgi:hypothetical protein
VETSDWYVMSGKALESERMKVSRRVVARAVGTKSALSQVIQQRLCHY